MTKLKSSASSLVIPSIFVIHLVNDTQFLSATEAALLCAVAMISLFIEIKASQ